MGQTNATKKHNAKRKANGRLNAEKWIRLRARGWSLSGIAAKFGVTDSAVSQSISKYYKDHPIPGADELRMAECAKLDDREAVLQRQRQRVVKAAEKGVCDTEALTRIDSRLHYIAERRAKLLGLDTPVRVDPDLIVSTSAAAAAATVAAVSETKATPAVMIVLATDVGADEEG